MKKMRSYTLAICENEKVQAQFIQKILQEYAEANKLHFYLPIFESAEAFLFEYAENKEVDLLFLDIQMNEMDGLSLADTLRQQLDQVKIIFITGLTEHIGEGYRVAASDYLIKPIKKEQLFTVVERVLNSVPKESSYLIINYEDEQIKVAAESIICAEIMGRELFIRTIERDYLIKSTMQELAKQLDEEQFIQTNRSWLVNCQHIERVKKTEVIMDNGMEIPISRRNSKVVTQAFINYFRKE